MHPLVVSSAALRALGWRPTHDNEANLEAVLAEVRGATAIAGRRIGSGTPPSRAPRRRVPPWRCSAPRRWCAPRDAPAAADPPLGAAAAGHVRGAPGSERVVADAGSPGGDVG